MPSRTDLQPDEKDNAAMKNTTIFALVLSGLAGTFLLALSGTSRTATVEGTFGPEIRRVDYHWAYLHDDAQGCIIDSCLIAGNRFTLTGKVARRQLPCRITFSGFSPEAEVVLHPQQTVRLNITARPDMSAPQYEEAIRNAIARLDSAGYTIPDSI